MPVNTDLASNIIAALQLTEPNLDTSIGTPVRKLIDAAAGSIVEYVNEEHLLNYQRDIDSMSGGALDDFVATYGMSRIQAQRATGTVTFARPASVATGQVAQVALGTQIMAAINPPVYVQTIATAVLPIGQTSVDVPVQALVPGPQGNVAAGTLINFVTGIPAITSVTNSQPLTGGANQEDDATLRARFKSTVFRNLAGTDQMYRAMALQVQADPTDPSSRAVTMVNVLGPKKSWSERVEVSGGSATSSITDATYIYPSSVFVGPSIGAGELLTPNTQYTATITSSGGLASLTLTEIGTGMPDGFYDLEFDYVPLYSRNDPMATRWGTPGAFITNRVDVWVNGLITRQATQSSAFATTSPVTFNNVANDPMQASRYAKLDGTAPSAGDFFLPLGFVPVTSISSISGGPYVEGTDYDIVHMSDAFGYSPVSPGGIVWYASGSHPTSGSSVTIAYNYNAVPTLVQQSIESQWRLLGTDVEVHAGIANAYRFHFGIVYARSFDTTAVNTAIDTALALLVDNLGFDSALQVSDILQTVHNVPGVDNVRFLTSTDDGTNYGIQLIYPDGTPGPVSEIGGRAADVYFDDAHYPLYHSSRIIPLARNTFGVS